MGVGQSQLQGWNMWAGKRMGNGGPVDVAVQGLGAEDEPGGCWEESGGAQVGEGRDTRRALDWQGPHRRCSALGCVPVQISRLV